MSGIKSYDFSHNFTVFGKTSIQKKICEYRGFFMILLNVILTSFFSLTVLFIIAKIIGHKQMAQLDFFDYITGITIGSIAAELATEIEEPLKPLIAMVVYGVITVIINVVTTKFTKSRKFINGTPSVVMDNGKLYKNNMKKAKLDLSDFMVMCRQQGYFDLNDIQTAVYEYNGKLSVLAKSEKRPANPSDMNLTPAPAHIGTEVIMDGKILEENLKRMGLEANWLKKQILEQGYKDAKEIFLCICDNNKQLSVFTSA